jgi:exodeoxyribonuclease VII small subunit
MSKKPKRDQSTDAEAESADSFEYHLEQLERVVQKLEQGKLDLSESLQAFESGLMHLRQCHQKLGEAEQRISLVMNVDAQGQARLRELDLSTKNRPEQEIPGDSTAPQSDPAAPSGSERSSRLF